MKSEQNSKENLINNSETASTDIKEIVGSKHILSKFEYDLYHEEDDISMPVIRVKRTGMPNKGEKWRIMENNKVILIVDGVKLSKKEREFLRTATGVLFLINQHKQGIRSFNSLKAEIKKILLK